MTRASARAATARCFIRTAAVPKEEGAISPLPRIETSLPADGFSHDLDRRRRRHPQRRRADGVRLQAVGRTLRAAPALAADARLRRLHAAQTRRVDAE